MNIELIIIIIVIIIVLFMLYFIFIHYKKEGGASSDYDLNEIGEINIDFNIEPVNRTNIRFAIDFLKPEHKNISILRTDEHNFGLLCANITNKHNDTMAGIFDANTYQKIENKTNEIWKLDITDFDILYSTRTNDFGTIGVLNSIRQIGIFTNISVIKCNKLLISKLSTINRLQPEIPNITKLTNAELINVVKEQISRELHYDIYYENIIID